MGDMGAFGSFMSVVMLMYLSTEPHRRMNASEHLNAHLCEPTAVRLQPIALARVTRVVG